MLAELKSAAFLVSRQAGLTRWIANSRWRRTRLLVLCYHGVSLVDEHEWNPELYISRATLARRFALLQRAGCSILSLDEAVRCLYAGRLPDRAVTITFDDGYCDFTAGALPLLTAYGWPATVYVTTHQCDRRRPVVHLLASYALWKHRHQTLDARGIAGLDRIYPLASSAARQRAVADMQARMSSDGMNPDDERLFARQVLERLGIEDGDLSTIPVLCLMTAADLADVARRGIAIELHTHRHRVAADGDDLMEEIRVNRATVRAATGCTPRHFCYPNGTYRASHLPALEREGIESATTCDPDLASPASHRLLLPRLVDNEMGTDLRFEAWVTGLATWLPRRTRKADVVD
ncbi:MAG: polysaccharide deacetylase family protein [Vicinamibacterales bacterium]